MDARLTPLANLVSWLKTFSGQQWLLMSTRQAGNGRQLRFFGNSPKPLTVWETVDKDPSSFASGVESPEICAQTYSPESPAGLDPQLPTWQLV